jgi:hypothetical protein
MPQNEWEIAIDRFEGFVPAFWENANPSFGNKGHASDMQNVDMIDPSVMTQGPGLSNLTNGTQAAAITTLIKGMLKISPDGTNCYGVGGNKFYKFTSTAVTNAGDWPHTITAASGTADGEDVAYYKGYYFYSYDYSGAGNVGRFDGTSTFDDDYMSTVPTGGSTLQDAVPHQMIVAGDDKLYIANGQYVASFDGTTFVDQALDFPSSSVVQSLLWEHNKIYIAVNRPGLSTDAFVEASIYLWDTTSSSWEYQIRVPGKIGSLYTKNGVVFLYYLDASSSGAYHLAYIEGNQLRDAAAFTGSLPNYYQTLDHKNHLAFLSGGELWLWGASSHDLPVKLTQYADAGYATAGGITNAFGTPIIASNESANYKLAKLSGYDVNASWKSILFDLSNSSNTAYISSVVVFAEAMSTGAQLDTVVTYNYGTKNTTSDAQKQPSSIAYDSNDTEKTRHVILRKSVNVENFRIDLDWSNGSATNPVKVRKILIRGYYATDK